MGIRKIIIPTLLVGLLAIALAGCANGSTDYTVTQPADRGDASELSTSKEAPSLKDIELSETPFSESLTTEPATGEVPSDIMNEVIADLAKRKGAEHNEIQVVREEAVVWNDGSLGCPEPGEFYIQMMISGYWVVLQVEGVEYDYRVSDKSSFKLCEGENMPSENSPVSGEPVQNPLVLKAKGDLAERLGIPLEEIKLLSFDEVVWPDSSLGCPQPGITYAQVPQDGTLIRLGVGMEMYFYHSDGGQTPFLCEGTSQIVPSAILKSDELIPPPGSELD
jgi:hypothetical protein